jgi:hypothetical protein
VALITCRHRAAPAERTRERYHPQFNAANTKAARGYLVVWSKASVRGRLQLAPAHSQCMRLHAQSVKPTGQHQDERGVVIPFDETDLSGAVEHRNQTQEEPGFHPYRQR